MQWLLSKHSPYIWTEEQQFSFEWLKFKLCSAPVLVHYDQNKPIRVQTDASYLGIGYVLCHVIDGNEFPFRYGSRSLKPEEENYTVLELEALAFQYAITSNRQYLLGIPFLVITDHHSLCWILRAKDTNMRVSRWVQKLSEYNFTITYKNGKAHTNADALSRGPLRLDPNETEDDIPLLHNDTIDLAKLQKQDSWCTKLYDSILNSYKIPVRIGGKIHEIVDGVIYRIVQIGPQRLYQLCVPKSLRKDTLYSVHEDRTAGHFGLNKTYDKLRRRCYWPGMYRSLENYINNCASCLTKKPTSGANYGLGQLPETPSVPFSTCAVDLLGPFKQSSDGNKYVIVISDHCTRYTICGPLPDKNSLNIAKFIVEKLILVHGAQDRLLSDRGLEFLNALLKSILELIGTKQVKTTAYHPQGDLKTR